MMSAVEFPQHGQGPDIQRDFQMGGEIAEEGLGDGAAPWAVDGINHEFLEAGRQQVSDSLKILPGEGGQRLE